MIDASLSRAMSAAPALGGRGSVEPGDGTRQRRRAAVPLSMKNYGQIRQREGFGHPCVSPVQRTGALRSSRTIRRHPPHNGTACGTPTSELSAWEKP
jgi:hypothetical protein